MCCHIEVRVCCAPLFLVRRSHFQGQMERTQVLWMNNSYLYIQHLCCSLSGSLTIKHDVFVYPAEIIEQTCAFLTQTKRLPL